MSKEQPDLVCVHRCYGLDVAHILKSKLDAAEIPSLLQYESAGPVLGITVDGLGEVCILVPGEFADEATQLLTEMPDDALMDIDDQGEWQQSPATNPRPGRFIA